MDTTSLSKNDKSLGMAIHLSTFLKYFFPFGNFIGPLVLWTTNREKPFIDHNGREAINFQLSLLLYGVVIGVICLPFFFFYAGDFISVLEHLDDAFDRGRAANIQNLSGYLIVIFIAVIVTFCIFIFELWAVITAAMRASSGQEFKYPLCIRFIKVEEPTPAQAATEPAVEAEDTQTHSSNKSSNNE